MHSSPSTRLSFFHRPVFGNPQVDQKSCGRDFVQLPFIFHDMFWGRLVFHRAALQTLSAGSARTLSASGVPRLAALSQRQVPVPQLQGDEGDKEFTAVVFRKGLFSSASIERLFLTEGTGGSSTPTSGEPLSSATSTTSPAYSDLSKDQVATDTTSSNFDDGPEDLLPHQVCSIFFISPSFLFSFLFSFFFFNKKKKGCWR